MINCNKTYTPIGEETKWQELGEDARELSEEIELIASHEFEDPKVNRLLKKISDCFKNPTVVEAD